MHYFKQETLINILEDQPGIDLVSYGKPRDAFPLSIDVPFWTSGYGGQYEMRHFNVPSGVMIAVGDLEKVEISDQEKLKQQLKVIDIYPTGHSGDFKGIDLEDLIKWFTDRSVLDNNVNDQRPIAHAKNLTKEGLGQERFNGLVSYLTDNMDLFKDPHSNSYLVPDNRGRRAKIVEALLDGLSQTVRYTRRDDPAKAFQITGIVEIEKEHKGTIVLNLSERSKILVLRVDKKTKAKDLTPLDRNMLGITYVTADGKPLGERGSVDLSFIVERANEIENDGVPMLSSRYIRGTHFGNLKL